MGIDDDYKVIMYSDIDKYSNYLEIRKSFDGLEVVLEFYDSSGVENIKTLAQVRSYMEANRDNWFSNNHLDDDI